MSLKQLAILAAVIVSLMVASLLGGFRTSRTKTAHHFQYCIEAARPADAEAIRACREAAEAISRKR